jgi:SEC-C motif-containing protein
LQTWHASRRPAGLGLDAEPAPKWLGLKIIATRDGGASDDAGEVEFVARYKVQGRAVRLHERSRFVREQGYGYYLDGQTD